MKKMWSYSRLSNIIARWDYTRKKWIGFSPDEAEDRSRRETNGGVRFSI